MKNTQQFCESIYHKYELALETRREKQRVRFMIVQRSAAAAAVVTVAVGSSVFIIHQKDGKLPVTPGASISASKDPAGRVLITAASAGLVADNSKFNVVPPSGEVVYSPSLDELVGSEETDDALFRLSVSIYGDTEDAKADVRASGSSRACRSRIRSLTSMATASLPSTRSRSASSPAKTAGSWPAWRPLSGRRDTTAVWATSPPAGPKRLATRMW